MDFPKRLTSQHNTEEQVKQVLQQEQRGELRFHNAEELLRHDALHTPVPPSIEHRLQESLEQHPPAPAPWWRRLFKRSGS